MTLRLCLYVQPRETVTTNLINTCMYNCTAQVGVHIRHVASVGGRY